MFKQKFAKVIGVGLAIISPVVSLAAAPTEFSTTTASTILGSGYDTIVSMVSSIIPMLLPVIATLGFIFMVWGFIKSKLRFKA